MNRPGKYEEINIRNQSKGLSFFFLYFIPAFFRVSRVHNVIARRDETRLTREVMRRESRCITYKTDLMADEKKPLNFLYLVTFILLLASFVMEIRKIFSQQFPKPV